MLKNKHSSYRVNRLEWSICVEHEDKQAENRSCSRLSNLCRVFKTAGMRRIGRACEDQSKRWPRPLPIKQPHEHGAAEVMRSSVLRHVKQKRHAASLMDGFLHRERRRHWKYSPSLFVACHYKIRKCAARRSTDSLFKPEISKCYVTLSVQVNILD